jgi:tellurite resistance protein
VGRPGDARSPLEFRDCWYALGLTRMATDEARIHLLARVARGGDVSPEKPASILSLSAAAYGARPQDEATVPTGFDPHAVALFETIVEGAYLVAKADGEFDDAERKAFERVVVSACGGTVTPKQIGGLVADLQDQLDEDGVDQRIKRLAAAVPKKEHAIEVLRIAALLADASEGVSPVERQMLSKIAAGCGLDTSEVERAIADVRAALSGTI